jgi:ankyrin repeat protein
MVKMDDNVKALFAAMRSMAGKTVPVARKKELRAEVHRLIELVPIDSANISGNTLLAKAIRDDDIDLVRYLLQKGANSNGQEKQKTPLMEASRNGNVEIMKILIDAGANLHACRLCGWRGSHNALDCAIRNGHVEAVRLLVTNGLKTYSSSAYCMPLHTAAIDNRAAMLSLLLEHGVGDVLAVDIQGCTPLHYAARLPQGATTAETTDSQMMAVLLDHGAAIDQLSRNGKSALHIAVEYSNLQAVLFLLTRGANAALVGGSGMTALHNVAGRHHFPSHVEIAKALLAQGAQADAVNGRGRAPLHCIAFVGTDAAVPTARALLQAGANVDATDNSGEGPLHL